MSKQTLTTDFYMVRAGTILTMTMGTSLPIKFMGRPPVKAKCVTGVI